MKNEKNKHIIVVGADSLTHMTNLLNNGYRVIEQGLVGKRCFYILTNTPYESHVFHEPKVIEAFRVINVKNNENYVKETEILQKKGYEIYNITTTTATLVKYKETEAKQ